MSNPTLQRRLGWDSDRYFRSRDALVDLGLVVRGRGRGGVVRRVLAESAAEERTVAVVVEAGADAATTAATVEAVIKNELLTIMRNTTPQGGQRGLPPHVQRFRPAPVASRLMIAM